METVTEEKHTKKVRQSGVELLRLFAMFLIVAHHYVVHNSTPLFAQSFLFILIGTWGRWGVAVFVLISGFFLCREQFKLKKLVKMLIQISFFSFIISLAFFLFHNVDGVSIINVFYHLAPITLNGLINETWFVVPYIFLYLCFPLLNIIINAITSRVHLLIVFVGVLYLSIIPSISQIAFDISSYPLFSDFTWFIVLYFIAAYIRKYPKKWHEKIHIILFIFFSSSFLVILVYALKDVYLDTMWQVFGLISAVSCLLLFLNIKFKSRIINTCAGATFAIYLIHDANVMRNWLWHEVFIGSGTFMHAFYSISLVFFICMAIGIIYNYTINVLIGKLLDKHVDNLQERFTSYLNNRNKPK